MSEENEERRHVNYVVDRPTEAGIKVQNILTALVLGVMGWVGMNIESIKENVGDIKLETKLNSKEITQIRKRDDDQDARIDEVLRIIGMRGMKK